MKAEAIISSGSSASVLNQTRAAGGDPMGTDFLMALMAAMMPPLGIDTQSPVGMELLEQQTKSPEDGEIINVFPGVNVVAENGGNAVFPDFTMILSGGPTTESREELNSVAEALNPVVTEEYRQAVLAAEMGLTPDNPVNSFGQGNRHFASPATDIQVTDHSQIERITAPVQQFFIPEGVNIGVSETAVGSEAVTQSLTSGSEGSMKAQEATIPLPQSQVDRVDQMMITKESKTEIPAHIISDQSVGQGQVTHRPQSPVEGSWSSVVPDTVETQNIPVKIAMAEDAGIINRDAESANVGSSPKGLDDTGETKWQNISSKSDGESVAGVRDISRPGSNYSGQNPGGQGEKEKVIINAGQDHKRVTDASTFMQEDRQGNAVQAQNSGMPIKQADSVIVTEGKPPLTEVYGNQGARGKSEETVSPGENAQGVRAENIEPGPGQEQTQVNSGTVNLSNITPRKFPSEILPHLMNPVRSINADGRVTVIRLKLEPENMGEIKIRISYAKGKMAAHFYTSSGLVREAIECSLPQLKETLAQYKVDLGEATASVGQEQQNNGFGSTGFGHNGRMKGFAGVFSGGDLGEKSVLTGMGDDQRINLLI